jgi:hypothetical protein
MLIAALTALAGLIVALGYWDAGVSGARPICCKRISGTVIFARKVEQLCRQWHFPDRLI